MGPEGRPGNLRGVNRTSTAVTGQDKVHPVLGAWPWTTDGARWVTGWGGAVGYLIPSAGGRPVEVQCLRPGRTRVRPPRVSIAMAMKASGVWNPLARLVSARRCVFVASESALDRP